MGNGERELIGDIRKRTSGMRVGPLRIGIGDDCAVLGLPSGHEMLVTTDLFIEGIHFRREWQSPQAAGGICITRGLSDIAAMGGAPVAAFLSLAVPKGTPRRWISGFFNGVVASCGKYGMPLAGGDTSASPDQIIADIVLVGSAPRKMAVLRSGAQSGDLLYVTNSLGRAHSELQRLLAGAADQRRYLPQPQLQAGQRLRRLASAMIDTSDGLSVDLAHLCNASKVSAVVDIERLPIAPSATLEDALHGGEDYQLLFTAPPRSRVPGHIGATAIRLIGEIVSRKQAPVLIMKYGKLSPLPPLGWEHRDLTR
ncbi:MAG: thiamine-phosphate kinase [Acidobacteriaceae bacterium]